MIYREYKPSPQLAVYVECYWSAKAEQPPFNEQESLIPDGTIELMFNFGDHYSQVIDDREKLIKGSHVIGIRKQSLFISQTSKQNFFSIRFKPGGFFPFFKIPVYKFANGFYQISELFNRELNTLEYQLYEAANNRKRVEIIEQFLLNKLSQQPEDFAFVQTCAKRLVTDSSCTVEHLADQFSSNYKTIERKFLDVIGLTPSKLRTVKRFNQAVHAMYSGNYNSLAEIAYASGYYDQSHFIRQFKKLASATPRQFLEQQLTIVKVIQPALAKRLSNSYNFS
ncbi:Helix-turn-helix domain-containing protein [Fodinibius roseus]|uniref:Helix-turn-helix domain-containing protein n=1 Tax=Fodinibius roseus TaxID=1194090 RepID=A0A1M5ES79_9BACT|nr:helix-turn-helix domain-containing protein [Fodinibius roseus]SHF82115.1 Helix-turn-helix domain-containing protein [Fodinibius roseus]